MVSDAAAAAAAAAALAVPPGESLGSSYSVEAWADSDAGLDNLRASSVEYGQEGKGIHEHYDQCHIPLELF